MFCTSRCYLIWSSGGAQASDDASLNFPQPNRGFKGIGPAVTEPENQFACTIHSRECRGDVLGDEESAAYW